MKITLNRKVAATSVVIIAALLTWLVWPTPYFYRTLTSSDSQMWLLRVHRVSGNVDILRGEGWSPMRPPPLAPKAPADQFTDIRPLNGLPNPPMARQPPSTGPDLDALARKYGGKPFAQPPPQQASDGRLVLPPTPQPKTVSTPLDELSSQSANDGRFLPVSDGCALVRARDGTLLLPWNCLLPGFPMDREPPAETHHFYIFWRLDQLIVRGGAGLLAAFGIGVFVGQTATWKAIVARWLK